MSPVHCPCLQVIHYSVFFHYFLLYLAYAVQAVLLFSHLSIRNYKCLLKKGSGPVSIGNLFLTPPTTMEGVHEFQQVFARKHSIVAF